VCSSDLEKGGLNKLPLSLPKRALARNESVSEHRLERPCSEVLDVVLGICDQHLLDKIRSACQEQATGTYTETRKRTVLAGSVEQKVEKLGAELSEVAANQRALRPWRQSRAD